MARNAGAVQADIALTRRDIEHELDVLHSRVPKREWLAYAWLAGGLALGVLFSRAPILTVATRGLRLMEVSATLMGAVAMLADQLVARTRDGHALGPGEGRTTQRARPAYEVKR
jgi:hypothetical protein